MKFTASTLLRWFGFRRTLIVNGLISGAFLAACALFTPTTPHWVLLVTLLAGGFFRSLEFTALNAISYADIDPPRMSRATSFASVSQQMSGAIGVAVAAICVQIDPVRLRRLRARGARSLARLRHGGDLLLTLLTGGFFRSLEFTALNAISYADIDPPRMSRATSFASVSQQMSGAIGVAVGCDLRAVDPVRLRRSGASGARPFALLRPGGDHLEPVGLRLRPAQAGRGRGGFGQARDVA